MPPVTTLVAFLLLGQIPAEDSRYANTPHTNTHFTMPSYPARADWEARKAALRRQILSASGLAPLPERTPLNAQVFGRIERKDYSIEKVLLETMPGYYLGGNLYRPRRGVERRPAVVTPHGHWKDGRLESSPTFSG